MLELQAGLRGHAPIVVVVVSGTVEHPDFREGVVIQMLRVDQLGEEFLERGQRVLTTLDRQGARNGLQPDRRDARCGHDPLAGRLGIDREAVDVVARVVVVEARQHLAFHDDRPELPPLRLGAVALASVRVLAVGKPEIDRLAVVVGAAVVLNQITVRSRRDVQLGGSKKHSSGTIAVTGLAAASGQPGSVYSDGWVRTPAASYRPVMSP